MPPRQQPVASPQTLRRRRLAALALAGLCTIVVAAAVDLVRSQLWPEPAASAIGGQAAAARPWVWSGPPTAVAELPAAAGAAPVITRVDTTDPVVFLTIDDGHTRSPAAAAVVRELGIPATLFLLDGPIGADPAWFAGLRGSVVESHSRSHPDMTTLPESAQRDEICGNADVIERAYGRRPVLFRPPYGSYDDATSRAAAACGMRAVVLWQQSVNGATVGYRDAHRFRAGDIILMHFRPSFVQELNLVKARVEAAGLRFALLEDYIAPDTVSAG